MYLYSISDDAEYKDGAYKFITYEYVYELVSGNFTSIRSVLEKSYYSLTPSCIELTPSMLNLERKTIEMMRDGNESYKKYQKWYGGGSDNYIIYLNEDYKSIFDSLDRQYIINSIISIYE